jgi:hypothetical protein
MRGVTFRGRKGRIRMLVDDARLGFKKGEEYDVVPYPYDEKLSVVNADFNVYLESCGKEWAYVNPS